MAVPGCGVLSPCMGAEPSVGLGSVSHSSARPSECLWGWSRRCISEEVKGSSCKALWGSVN